MKNIKDKIAEIIDWKEGTKLTLDQKVDQIDALYDIKIKEAYNKGIDDAIVQIAYKDPDDFEDIESKLESLKQTK